MTLVPGTDRWIVTRQDGKLYSFNRSGDPDQQLAVDLKQIDGWHFAAFGMAFHPEYPKKPWCYITYKDQPKSETGAKLSRFTVTDTAIPKIDLDSEVEMLKWRSHDHMGGQPLFGPDGYLYMSIGDGQRPSPPDPLNTGQDPGDLQASILRIDINKTSGNLAYSIPADNPFVGRPGFRPEIWAFGVRNPWRLCFRDNGELWVGDVGWETREMVYRIEKGANYGWSVSEGSQSVKPIEQAHAIPISKPIVEHDHTKARSITGGFFWDSDRIPSLKGAYVYGDWMTGIMWALRYDSETEKVTSLIEIADTPHQIISFAKDSDGEVLILAYDGTIHRLIENPRLSDATSTEPFPGKLSETGLFESVAEQTPSPGVYEYDINAHHWADGTTSRQWIGVVDENPLHLFEKSNWMTGDNQGHFDFPHNTAIAKTIYLETEPGNPASRRRIETQVLHRFHDEWMAYNYIWNDQQTDAILQDNVALETEFEVAAPESIDKVEKRKWLHASRDQCKLCHIWNAGSVHGFKPEQLERTFGNEQVTQLEKFHASGLFAKKFQVTPVTSPYNDSASIQRRARSWLALNCAHCHRFGGGGSGAFQLNGKISLEEMKLIDQPAMQGDFGLKNPMLIASGNPSNSALLYRLLKSGHGRMPQFGTNRVDDRGVVLLHDWIRTLGDSPEHRKREVEIRMMLSGEDIQTAELPDSTAEAIALAVALSREGVATSVREQFAQRLGNHPAAEVRDLFERFLPSSMRVQRMGQFVDAEKILSSPGDAAAGRKLWFGSNLSCRNCHQIGGKGQMVGPTMDGIGSKRTAREILNSILDPSATIEDPFRGHVAMTSDGELISGLKVEQTDKQLVLIDASGQRHEIATDDIEESKPLSKSLMPERLLSEMTFEQAVNLLEFLKGL